MRNNASIKSSSSLRIVMITDDIRNSLAGRFRGGTEKQNRLLAEALRDIGHSVEFLDLTHEGDSEEVTGFILHSIWENDSGIPGLRYIYYRYSQLKKVLRTVDADIYYLRGTGGFLGLAAYICRKLEKPFIWGLGNDWCLDARLRKERFRSYSSVSTRINKELLSRLGVFCLKRYSSAIVCQTRSQKMKLGKTLSYVRIISNICDYTIENSRNEIEYHSIVWVGKLHGHKGENALADLTVMLPEMTFIVMGEISGAFRRSEICERLENASNVQLTGRKSHPAVMEAISKAGVLISTSSSEGFSNAYLEAWSCGTPVVTLNVDPDNLIEDRGLGFTAYGNIAVMADRIRRILNDLDKRREISSKAVKYVRKNHDSGTIAARFNNLMVDVRFHIDV